MKHSITQKALTYFMQYGFKSFTMDDLANSLGISKKTLYEQFSSKNELVEAALDEANVKRFGDYLNRFDKESQFIVVTHRKGTMSAADSIYGVTMQESGVSKIVSVKLKDLENEE